MSLLQPIISGTKNDIFGIINEKNTNQEKNTAAVKGKKKKSKKLQPNVEI